MEWSDSGSILALRPHGETAALVEVFTATHGRHAGILRGGASRRRAAELQLGTKVVVTWRARLSEHLGVFTLEAERGRAAALMGDRLGLAGLAAICALAQRALPERAPFQQLQVQTETLLDLLPLTPAWPLAYLQWEMALLEALGFGLDLRNCAVTGMTEDLIYVSPRTGRAVSGAGAGDWSDRLLPLPGCMRGEGNATDAEILQGLGVTGHFLDRALGDVAGGLPGARDRLIAALSRHSDGAKTI
ncbi:MAG: DNA repair protein RecO [Pseudomonadota bacterium]